MEGIEEMNASWVKIKVDKPTPAHTDGEIFSTDLKEFEYKIFPKKLQIILP
ncbi:hypothetical protein ACFLXB_08000 [Chloroflexota bacterium]